MNRITLYRTIFKIAFAAVLFYVLFQILGLFI